MSLSYTDAQSGYQIEQMVWHVTRKTSWRKIISRSLIAAMKCSSDSSVYPKMLNDKSLVTKRPPQETMSRWYKIIWSIEVLIELLLKPLMNRYPRDSIFTHYEYGYSRQIGQLVILSLCYWIRSISWQHTKHFNRQETDHEVAASSQSTRS